MYIFKALEYVRKYPNADKRSKQIVSQEIAKWLDGHNKIVATIINEQSKSEFVAAFSAEVAKAVESLRVLSCADTVTECQRQQ